MRTAAVARLLLAANADVDAMNKYGETALMLAKENDSEDVTDLLKAAGAETEE